MRKSCIVSNIMTSLGLFSIAILGLSCLATNIFREQQAALAQQYVQTIKYRNLVIDLGNRLKTNAQLTFPAIGNGPFPGVLLIPGSGAVDKNETLGFVHKNGPNPPAPFWQIAQYLSERGFAVLRYDKRGVGANFTILDKNVWGNVTVNDLIHDAERALNVLMGQPEVDPERISLVGDSEGTVITPRVAIDNSTNVKNIVLMATVAQNFATKINYYQYVYLPSAYATQVLDKNQTGLISIQQIAKDPLVAISKYLVPPFLFLTHNTKGMITTLAKEFGTSGYISIDKQLKPLLTKRYENSTAFNLSRCNNLVGCPIWLNSELNLEPTLNIIGNVSKSTGILLLNGENDSQTPIQQALLLQQRLTEVNHPDHTLITYPNLGHAFSPSSQWSTGVGSIRNPFGVGPIEQYVLADLYAWLEAHSGLSRSFVGATTSTIGTNASSVSINTNSTSYSNR